MNSENKNGGAEAQFVRAIPVCDVWEAEDGVHVLAEMPGVDPASVEVTVERDVLTIRGQAELPRPSAAVQGLSPTIPTRYARAFQLAETADADSIQAACKDGLVRVLVPRRKPAQRRIAVVAG